MSYNFSPKIVVGGLVLYLDAANSRSIVSGSTTWTDLSKNGNNGTLVNSPTFNSGNGGSIVFNGSSQYVNLGNTNISLPVNITINAWIKPTILSDYRNILTKEGATSIDLDYGLTTSPNGNLYFWFNNGSFRIHESTTSTMNQTNVWYNVTSVFDDTNNNVKLYVNSNQIYSASETTSMLVHSNSNLLVGWRNSLATNQSFSGNIALVQLYNRALSASEVLQNYNALKSRFGLI
jgi:hypothetical protein